MSKKNIKYLVAALAIKFLPLMTLAENGDGGGSSGEQKIANFTLKSIEDILEKLKNWFSGILAILGVIIMLYAAFLYMIAAGDEEKSGKAKKTLLYGLVGVGIALLAYAVFSFVESILVVNP